MLLGKKLSWLLVICSFPTVAMAGNNAGAAFSTWPDTGQENCYEDEWHSDPVPCPTNTEKFYGQDAQYSGPIRSYTLLGGGIMVRDNVTGLIWERKNAKDGIEDYANPHDADNRYTWCDTNPSTNGGYEGICDKHNPYTGEYQYDTERFISALNSETFGGYSDWRLPTIKELITLLDYSSQSDTNTTFFPNTALGTYWSSTTIVNTSAPGYNAWCISFGNYGGALSAYTGKGYWNHVYFVRAVRSAQ